jgi:hypothetical protein
MARIPTMNPMSITAPPGSAGGVKLGPTGVGAVPIQTPLTQRYNPSEFGKEGAAIAQLGQAIFNDAVIPMMELQKRNARAKETLDQSNKIYGEMNSVKQELLKNELTPGFDYLSPVHESKAWAKHFNGINTRIDGILPSIKANVSDPKHAVALSNAFMPQIMQLKLKAQNRAVEVSENSTVLAYQKGLQDLVNELGMRLPKEVTGGEPMFVFKTKEWEGLMQKKQLLDNLFENSGVNPTKKYQEQLAGRKLFVDQLIGAMLQNPKMGLAFLEQGMAEKFGISQTEKGEMEAELTKLEWTQTRMKIKKDEQKDKEDDAKVKLEVEGKKNDHWLQALKGDIDLTAWTTYETDYKRGGYESTWGKIYALLKTKEILPGESKPVTFAKYQILVQAALGDPTQDISALVEDIALENDLSGAHRIQMISTLAGLKNNASLVKWPVFQQAEDYLKRMAPVPLDPLDKSASAIRNRATWELWNQTKEKYMLQKPEKFRSFKWFDRAQQLVNDHAKLWNKPEDEGAQIVLNDYVTQSGLAAEPGVLLKDGGKNYPDVSAMRSALLRRLPGMKKEEIKQANDAIHTLATYPGLEAKVIGIKAQANQQNPPPEKTISGPQQFMRDITKDEWEAMGKKYFPEKYKTLFGETPEKTAPVEKKPAPPEVTEEQLREAIEKRLAPEPQPEPKPEPVMRGVVPDERQTEMFQEEKPAPEALYPGQFETEQDWNEFQAQQKKWLEDYLKGL